MRRKDIMSSYLQAFDTPEHLKSKHLHDIKIQILGYLKYILSRYCLDKIGHVDEFYHLCLWLIPIITYTHEDTNRIKHLTIGERDKQWQKKYGPVTISTVCNYVHAYISTHPNWYENLYSNHDITDIADKIRPLLPTTEQHDIDRLMIEYQNL